MTRSARRGPTRLEDRVRPHSEEAERAVLAACLLSPDVVPRVSGRLSAEDFYLERHRLIYGATLRLVEDGTPVDLRTLQAELGQELETVGGLAYLSALDLDLPDIARIGYYAEIVKERSIRRRLIQRCGEITRVCLDGDLRADAALELAEAAILDLGQESTQRGFVALGGAYEVTVAEMEERAGGMLGIPTGFYDWDRMTQGLVKGNLIIIAGRPGSGKTSFATNVAQHVTLREGRPVGIFSLEMAAAELTQRILSSETGLPFAAVRSGHLSEAQWSALYDRIRDTAQAPLFIDDSPNPSFLEISSKARRLKSERGLGLLVVDYVQLMQAPGRYENRNLEVAALSRGFKQLAKELEIPVMLLSQLSRQPERRSGDHRPQLADLRDSGAIEQDADMVCFLYRDELYNKDDPDNKGLAELIVAKHRNGETGTVELVFIGENTTFRNLDRRYAGEEPPF